MSAPTSGTMASPLQLITAYERVRNDLLAARGAHGQARNQWAGHLASSALSTATAVSALAISACQTSPTKQDQDSKQDWDSDQSLIGNGCRWIVDQQNPNGGWGDTDLSHSNISTSMLCKAALTIADRETAGRAIGIDTKPALTAVDRYLQSAGGVAAIKARYGRDRTFAVPILANAALAGLVDWSEVARLPYEFATLPQSWYRFVQLPVVSYAIPALVAMGQLIEHHRPSPPLLRQLRQWARRPSLNVLEKMQPASGGFLEAIPLTSFVAMSLAAIGNTDHPVCQNGLRFLRDSVRDDGSWPIDTNLATWNTTLAINALSTDDMHHVETSWEWLLACQHRERHPFTGAVPGGWGWSDLSGAVPDADDTPGAMLALRRLVDWAQSDDPTSRGTLVSRSRQAATEGATWLLGLQNRDGGWPTFCRGWGKLPFDRSGSDLTAHAIRALLAWQQRGEYDSAIRRGWNYLERQQQADGSWIPLWFGNQFHPEELNPIYGTAKVLCAYRDANQMTEPTAIRGVEYLNSVQNDDGSWGGGPTGHDEQCILGSIEETSLAVEAILAGSKEKSWESANRGLEWLLANIQAGEHQRASPIGLYFAKLWYYETTYPLAFLTSALRAAVEAADSQCAMETSLHTEQS